MPLPVSYFNTHPTHPAYPTTPSYLAATTSTRWCFCPNPYIRRLPDTYELLFWENHHGETNPKFIIDWRRPAAQNHDSATPDLLTLHRKIGGAQPTYTTWPRLVPRSVKRLHITPSTRHTETIQKLHQYLSLLWPWPKYPRCEVKGSIPVS